MGQPHFWTDQEGAQRQVRELKRLKAVVDPLSDFSRRARDLDELAELASEEDDAETLAEVDGDLARLSGEVERFELKAMLSGPHDGADAFLAIQAGAGGTEACDWVAMLLRMYSRWLERRGFESKIVDSLEGEEAGYKSVTVDVQGPFAYGYCKSEVGVHRLVRISPFDAAARRHTSFASVDVAPQIGEAELDVEIDDKELRIDTFRAGGPGGQHVNVTDSAVRITHLPTNTVVTCQDEKSQLKNKNKAMRVLRARLLDNIRREHDDEIADQRRQMVSTGDRSAKIRTYNFPQNRVTDHRIGLTIQNLTGILDGRLDEITSALREAEQKERFAAAVDEKSEKVKE